MAEREDNLIVGWKAIAEEFGLSVGATRNLFRRAGIGLPKLGHRGRTSPVYLIRGQLFTASLEFGLRHYRPS